MPKQPGGVATHIRIAKLKELIKSRGRLRKPQINTQMAQLLDCTPKELERTLYRDLQDLVNANEIGVDHFTRNGEHIDEYDEDSEKFKNIYKEWFYLEPSAKDVSGASLLAKQGGRIDVPSILAPGVKIDNNPTHHDFKVIHILFNLHQQFYALKISHDVIKFKILIARTPLTGKEIELPTKKLETEFGKRLIKLFVPIPNVSSARQNQLGHLLIYVESPDRILLTDLGSKNGSSFASIKQSDVDEIRVRGGIFGEETVSATWSSAIANSLTVVELTKNEPTQISGPSLVWVSENFKFVIA